MLGDQQASLIGQSCVKPGRAKITFGTGGMLDLCTDNGAPSGAHRHEAGTYPLPLWSRDGEITWGVEAIMLSAGTNVEWLRDDLGLIATSAESHDVAALCDDTDGVVYVPALLGYRNAQVGLRRPGCTARHHPRHGTAARGPRRCSRASPTVAPT